MPLRPQKPCAYPGCPELVRSGRYCDEHQVETRHLQDALRGTSAERGYGYAWQQLRRAYLRSHPMCMDPFGAHKRDHISVLATDVDHITPRRAGGTDAEENLQALCHSCHSRKTDQHDGGFRGKGGSNLYGPQILDRSGSETLVTAKCDQGGSADGR